MTRRLRLVKREELDNVYMMGFDVWSEGQSEDEYLKSCHSSIKYQTGIWYVLADDQVLLSSLIVYNLDFNQIGICSIATPKKYRNQGYASELLNLLLLKLDEEFKDHTYFLYSDISSDFYLRFGFSKIDQSLQKYKGSTCMIRAKLSPEYLNANKIPDYF